MLPCCAACYLCTKPHGTSRRPASILGERSFSSSLCINGKLWFRCKNKWNWIYGMSWSQTVERVNNLPYILLLWHCVLVQANVDIQEGLASFPDRTISTGLRPASFIRTCRCNPTTSLQHQLNQFFHLWKWRRDTSPKRRCQPASV